MPPTADLDRIFARQHGVAADRQIRSSGVTWARQQRLIADGIWHRHGVGVVALGGSTPTWKQRAMAATLSSRSLALLSGASAARLHGFDGFAGEQTVEITLPYGAHDNTNEDVVVRWSRHLSRKDRHVVDGIPVCIQPVTLVQLADRGLDAGRALDSSLRSKKPPLWLRQNFERCRHRGSTAPDQLLAMLEEKMGKRLPLSWFQRLAAEVLARYGIVMEAEWPVYDAAGRRIASLDLADVALKVGLECQSIEFHATPADVARDIHRKRALRRLGWDVTELWWSDLNRIDAVVDDLRQAFDRARRLQA